mgnify:CR=1 FL=1|jgi:hypothetical protein
MKHLKAFNEASSPDERYIEQILNLARDEGYGVLYEKEADHNGKKHGIDTPFIKIYVDGTTDDGIDAEVEVDANTKNKFFQDMCHIYDRLHDMDYINTEYISMHPHHAFFMTNHGANYGYFIDGKHPTNRVEGIEYLYDSFFVYLH